MKSIVIKGNVRDVRNMLKAEAERYRGATVLYWLMARRYAPKGDRQ